MWTLETLKKAKKEGFFVPFSPTSPGSDVVNCSHYNGILESLKVPDWLLNFSKDDKKLMNIPLAKVHQFDKIISGANYELKRAMAEATGQCKISLIAKMQNITEMTLYAFHTESEVERTTEKLKSVCHTICCHILACQEMFGDDSFCDFFKINFQPDDTGAGADLNETQIQLVEYYFETKNQFIKDFKLFRGDQFSRKKYTRVVTKYANNLETLFVANPNFGFQLHEAHFKVCLF